ncbi:hypothetical protein GGR53DRAFT_33592 [Hypoxylon sp. FL1150]|nr:hypothetical protein GGR53DRAFT_33592 [Hypoxylon sp. FL1150]
MESEYDRGFTPALPRCDKCSKTFNDQHELTVHKLKTGHLFCEICGDSFYNPEALSAHRTQAHRCPACIVCPGCTKTFVNAGGWMRHVEDDECPSLFSSDMTGNTAQFMQQLNKEWGQRAQVDAVSKVFSKESHIKDTWADWKDDDAPSFDAQSNPDDFPATVTQGFPLSSQPGNVWSQKKNLFPEAQGRKAVAAPSTLTENYAGPTPATEPSIGPVLVPDMLGFDVEVFFNPILEVYTCPHKKCNVKCKTSYAMITHLKSPKHTAVEFRCPGCRGTFTTTSSWIQHAETVALSKCRIRNAAQFGRILREVSNGSLDVRSIRKAFDEPVQVKLSDDWGTPSQASAAGPVPGSNQWAESKQAEASGSRPKPNESQLQGKATWSGLARK